MQSCIGINYEGGKIIKHITKSIHCIAYANIQIAMDAPFHGRVADEKIRGVGRSELQFDAKYGYKDELVINKLRKIFSTIQDNYKETQIIIQIARGRSGISMYKDILYNILCECKFIDSNGELDPMKCKVIYGYRSSDYFDYSRMTNDFVFVNIGMFAVLTNVDNVCVGQICNANITYDILDMNLECIQKTMFETSDNILNNFCDIPKITLVGINDGMPFITPETYNVSQISHIIKQVS